MILKRIRPIFKPALYHGWGRRRKFFEGWYFKIANKAASRVYAIIPGISIDKRGSKHSFIQVLDGNNLKSEYHKFEFENFSSAKDKFEISIAGNSFSESALSLNLPGYKGSLEFHGLNRWPDRWYSPGIMGPYTFVPFMECYHGILSMDHQIKGSLMLNNKDHDFTGGRGYMEKDWGRSFPDAYIWMQSNHFDAAGISVKLSVARIPWLGSSFTGFIAGFLHDGKLYEFTTYNKSRLERVTITVKEISIQISNKNYRLKIRAGRNNATRLASPISGEMSGHISESMQSDLEISLEELHPSRLLYSGHSSHTALEVAGRVETLFAENNSSKQ
jgi:hypothetical protein